MAITAEERRRQRHADSWQGVPPGGNTAPSLFNRINRICSFQVKYRQFELIIIGLGIIGGIWLLISWLEIKFLGFW